MDEIPDLNRGPFFRRLTRWLCSRRIMRRILLGTAALMTLVAIVYTRVNLYGKSEWERCKRELAARGEVLDWSAYAPAHVPDDQNIFKAPKMMEWFGDHRSFFDQPLEHRITNSFAALLFSVNPTNEIRSTEAATQYLAASDPFQDDFAAISVALKRPSARVVCDYADSFSITLPNVATVQAVVYTLVQRAKSHLLLGRTDEAWQELTLLRDLRRMVEGQGKFITTEGDWMRRELARHSLKVIAKGLELHAWTEPQLAQLQEQLKQDDFIALHADALRCARALLATSLEFAPGEDGNLYRAAYLAGGDTFWARFKKHPELLLFRIAPRGAMYERATGMSQGFQGMINTLTPTNSAIHPTNLSQAFRTWKRAQEGLPMLLWTQTMINECRIACALERYRLAHGTYPETLGALAPQFIEEMPSDLINGQPLIYHLTDKDDFLLYSVGWNENDEGGKSIASMAHPETLKEGDWVWKSGMNPE